MAQTSIADVVVPEVYDDYFMEASIYKSALWRSGIVANTPKMDEMLAGGAEQFSMPFWATNAVRDAESTPVVEDGDVTPGKIGTGKMMVRRQFREYAWSQNDVAAVLAGENPEQAVMELVEDFWNRNYQKFLFRSILGVMADNVANDSSDLVNVTGAAIDSNSVIDTIGYFGDQTDGITAIAMHSIPYQTLQKANLIDSDPDNTQNIGWGTYLGKSVIVDDMLIDTTYVTILFKPGSFAFGSSFENYVPTEVDRDPAKSGGRSLMYTRRVFLLHPTGMSWLEGSVAGDFPTNAEIQLDANWDRVVAGPKNCGFSVMRTTG